MARTLPAAADVVVIGGGIFGASAAWHLTKQGAGKVVVLERQTVAAGASGRTGALLRQHYTNEPEATLAHLSLQTFRNWADVVSGDCGYEPCGVVVTVDNGPGCEENINLMHRNVAMQNRIGIESRVVTAAELKELQPFGNFDDIKVAAYERASGYVDSPRATRSLMSAAMRAGATLCENTAVQRILTDGGKVTGVVTDQGAIATSTVLVAAGPWSTKLMATAGVDLPVSTLRVQIVILHRPMEMDEPHFIYLDMAAGMFCRPWLPGRSLVGVGGGDQHDEVDPDDYLEQNDPDYPAAAIEAVSRRMPPMAGASYLHGHAGLYDMSPDTHPILSAAGPDGLYVAAGFSGAGFKKAPAIGQCLAELILQGQAITVDLHPFRLSRFNEPGWDKPWSDTEYIWTSDFGHKL